MINFTKFSIPEIAKQWGVKVHASSYPHGGKVWLYSPLRREVTCLRCLRKIASGAKP